METIAFVHGYDRKRKGLITTQTAAQCRKAAELYRKGEVSKLVLVSGSYQYGRKLSGEMRKILECEGVPRHAILMRPYGCNTGGEVFVGLTSFDGLRQTFFSVSSAYHVPRLKFIWALRGLPATRVVGTREGGYLFGGNIIDILLEISKFVLELCNNWKIDVSRPRVDE